MRIHLWLAVATSTIIKIKAFTHIPAACAESLFNIQIGRQRYYITLLLRWVRTFVCISEIESRRINLKNMQIEYYYNLINIYNFIMYISNI